MLPHVHRLSSGFPRRTRDPDTSFHSADAEPAVPVQPKNLASALLGVHHLNQKPTMRGAVLAATR